MKDWPCEVDDETRYAYKALMSDYYRGVYREYGTTKALFDAGFFDDGLPCDFDMQEAFKFDLPTSNLNKLIHNFQKHSRTRIAGPHHGHAVVLITTGAFSPIHRGHVEMMELAKKAHEARGNTVIGGFFCPGHDSYVGKKDNGQTRDAYHRIAAIEEMVRDSDWLEVDTWSALHMPCEVNFTDVYDRMGGYLLHQLRNVDRMVGVPHVAFVYGSDNHGFGLAFEDMNGMEPSAVCVQRGGKEVPHHVYGDNVIHVAQQTSAVSSTAVRRGEVDLDERVMQAYMGATPKGRYIVRDDGQAAIRNWMADGVSYEKSKRSVSGNAYNLRQELTTALQVAFAGTDVQIEVQALTEQRKKAELLAHQIGQPTISLDVFTSGKFNTNLSRAFDLAGGQIAAHPGMVQRPDTHELDFGQIPAGNYTLVEDDIATGKTVREVMSRLPPGVNITHQIILSELDGQSKENIYDVVDFRDFIVGSKHGGLVCKYKGRLVRVPYLMPFVNLRTRAKIPADRVREFSIAMWQANIRFFTELGNPMIVECDSSFQQFTQMLGYPCNARMVDFCQNFAKLAA